MAKSKKPAARVTRKAKAEGRAMVKKSRRPSMAKRIEAMEALAKDRSVKPAQRQAARRLAKIMKAAS